MSRDLSKAADTLRYFFPTLKAKYSEMYPDRELFITHVDRTPEEQLRLFCQGRLPEFRGEIVTWKDGFENKSRHNYTPSEAIDIAVRVKGVVSWDVKYAYNLGAIVKELGYDNKIRWGGSFGDNYHFEVI